MAKRIVSLRLDEDLWGTLPEDNKSKWIRDILNSYVNGDLVKDADIKYTMEKNRDLYIQIEKLERDKERLWAEIEQYREIYLPKPKKWWKWWR